MVIASFHGGKYARTHLSPPRLHVHGEHDDINFNVSSQGTQCIHLSSTSAWVESWCDEGSSAGAMF